MFSISRDGWKATSTALLATNTSLPHASSTKPVSAVDSSTNTAVSNATFVPSVTQSSLSTGTKAGIGVDAALATLAVISLVAYLVVRKGRRRSFPEHNVAQLAKEASITTLHELHGHGPVF